MNSQLPREPASKPGEPTDAPPGSRKKIHVLTERASRREALFHPQDNLKRRLPLRADDPDEELDLTLADAEVEVEADDLELVDDLAS